MEMTNEKEEQEGGVDLDKKDCPLSPTAWILFLSGEIYNEENKNNRDSTTPIITLLVAVALSIIALIFAVGTTNFPVNTINNILFGLLLALYIIIFFIFLYLIYLIYLLQSVRPKTLKRVEALKKLREKVISGETDSNKICKELEGLNERKESH